MNDRTLKMDRLVIERQSFEGCSKHPGENIQTYCYTCNELLCLNCLTKGHNNHEISSYSDYLGRRLKQAEKQLRRLTGIKQRAENLKSRLSSYRNEFERCYGESLKALSSFENVQIGMRAWKENLTAELERKKTAQLQRIGKATDNNDFDGLVIKSPKVSIRKLAKETLPKKVQELTPNCVLFYLTDSYKNMRPHSSVMSNRCNALTTSLEESLQSASTYDDDDLVSMPSFRIPPTTYEKIPVDLWNIHEDKPPPLPSRPPIQDRPPPLPLRHSIQLTNVTNSEQGAHVVQPSEYDSLEETEIYDEVKGSNESLLEPGHSVDECIYDYEYKLPPLCSHTSQFGHHNQQERDHSSIQGTHVVHSSEYDFLLKKTDEQNLYDDVKTLRASRAPYQPLYIASKVQPYHPLNVTSQFSATATTSTMDTYGSHLVNNTECKETIIRPSNIIVNSCLAETPGEYVSSYDVCVNPVGTMIFSDRKNLCLRILQDTTEVSKRMTKHFKTGIIGQPHAIAYDQIGQRILIASDGCLSQVNYSEKLKKLKSKKLITEITPLSITCTTSARKGDSTSIYATIWPKVGEPCIYHLDCNGHFRNKIVSLDIEKMPCGIDYKKGYLVVSTLKNGCLTKISPSGNPLWESNVDARTPGILQQPFSVAILPNEYIAVTECSAHRVSVFSKDGRLVLRFGELGTEPGKFNAPQGIAVRLFKELVVVDSGNDRIQIFSLDSLELSLHGVGASHHSTRIQPSTKK